MREIDYNAILVNIDEMINSLEYSAQRGGGKTKQAVHDINALYEYRATVVKKTSKPAKKEG